MIMPAGHQHLLLPVRPWFIWFSLLLSLLLEMALNMGLTGRAAWAPSLIAVTLLFWVVHEPQRVGVGACFVFGLLLDVHQSSLLGQHALAFSVLGYLASLIQRRLLWFSAPTQALQLLPLLFLAHALQWLVRLLAGAGWPDWQALLAPLIEALLWPLADWLLLAPQRRPHDPDDSRPL
jgi:rod shape-determining protein MreD